MDTDTTDEDEQVTISFGNSSLSDVVKHEDQVHDEMRYIYVKEGIQTETFTVCREPKSGCELYNRIS